MAGGVGLRLAVDLDDDSLNPHFAYDDEDNARAAPGLVSGCGDDLNEMRAARQLGLQTFALWRLGSEDHSLWKIWDTADARRIR